MASSDERCAPGLAPQIQLTSWPAGFAAIPLNSIVTNPSRSGGGAQVLNNIMFNNRGRGASVQASNSVIRGNNIQHMGSYEGITVSPNGIYAESEFPSNVVVGRPAPNVLTGVQPLAFRVWVQVQV